MFPLVPVQGVHIVGGKPAIGTHKGFSCMHFPNVSITTLFRACDLVTLGARVMYFSPHFNINLFLPIPGSFFTSDGVTPDTSIFGGGVAGGGVVIVLIDLSNCGRSPTPASFTPSSNRSHPCATI